MPVPTNEVTIGQQSISVETGALTLLAAGGVQDLFVITGGPIYLERMTGIVTTLIGCAATLITNLRINPTGGVAPLTEVDMCNAAVGLDLNTLAEDSQLSITGAVGDNMVATIIGIVTAPSFMTNNQILTPGTLELFTVGGTIVGAINWTIVYTPLAYGVGVAAA